MSLLLVGAINSIVATSSLARCPGSSAPAVSQPETPKDQSDPTPKLPLKSLKLSANPRKWEAVFTWLTNETGVPVVANSYPSGTFSFPKPEDRLYSVEEVIHLINIGLLSNRESRKYILLANEKVFILVGADEKIDGGIRNVIVEDLPKLLPSDLVRTRWQIKNQVALDLANELKPLLGPFGKIDVLTRTNTILITDIAANLLRLDKIINEVECDRKSPQDNYSHTCKYIPLRDAEKRLVELMGDPKVLFPENTATPKNRRFYITRDDPTNQIIITGPADKIAQAREILKCIDVPAPGGPAVQPKGFTFKRYEVPGGNADSIAKTVASTYRGAAVHIEAIGNTQILVYASDADHARIAQTLACGPDRGILTRRVAAGTRDAKAVAAHLTKLFADDKTGAPFIDVDEETNSVILRGTAEQLDRIARLIEKLQKETPGR
jgi:type II secretory pathway component GspD/PulD (secretin)